MLILASSHKAISYHFEFPPGQDASFCPRFANRVSGVILNNLLVGLHKWAWRQDENFITEAFAHLLRYLLEHERDIAVALLDYLTGGSLSPFLHKAKAISVTTQVTTDEGRPDVEIRTSDCLAYVEAKSDSDVRPDQLHHYRRALDRSEIEHKVLVLVTRRPIEFDLQDNGVDVHRRWYEVANEVQKLTRKDEVTNFLVKQFDEFLKERSLTMEKVGWELRNGVKAAFDLIAMVEEAIKAKSAQPTAASFGQVFAGYYVRKKDAWVGIYWESPTVLDFHTVEMTIDENQAREDLGYGERYRDSMNKPPHWRYRLDLESEEVHFFALTRESQISIIEQFIKKCLDGLDKIRK